MSKYSEFQFKNITHRLEDLKPEAFAALEQVLALVNAAQIPVCGSVFSVAVEVVKIINGISDNDAGCKEILETVEAYSLAISQFIEALTPDYVENSDDHEAKMARAAVQRFDRKLQEVQTKIRPFQRKNKFRKLFMVGTIGDAILSMAAMLRSAYEEFKHEISCVQISYSRTQRSVMSTLLASKSHSDNELDILGATPVTGRDFAMIAPIEVHDKFIGPRYSFWVDTMVANVAGQVTAVKIYNRRSGGKEALLRDLKILAENFSPYVPHIHAYCATSTPSFISFKTGIIIPFPEHVKMLLESLDRNSAVVAVWKLCIQMERAGRFMMENVPETTTMQSLERSVRDCVVDENGRVVVAPETTLIYGRQGPEPAGDDDSPFMAVTVNWGSQFGRLQWRPLRGLSWALRSNDRRLLSLREQEVDRISAQEPLNLWLSRQWSWPGGESRSAALPDDFRSRRDLKLGDVGVWRISPQGPPTFEIFGNAKHQIPVMYWGGGGGFVQVASSLSAYVYCHKLLTDPFWLSEKRIDSYAGCCWITSFDRTLAWKFLTQHAKTFAAQFGVPVEDLVIITKVVYYVRTDGLRRLRQTPENQLYFFVHINADHSFSHAYWSYSDQPLAEAEADPSIGTPYFRWYLPSSQLPIEPEESL